MLMGSAELGLAGTQQGGTPHINLGGVNDWWFSLPMHRALFHLSGDCWGLVGPGAELGCPELGTATGKLSGWILTAAEDCGYFQGIYQCRTRPWAFPVSG